jgi:hypothetical protein
MNLVANNRSNRIHELLHSPDRNKRLVNQAGCSSIHRNTFQHSHFRMPIVREAVEDRQ